MGQQALIASLGVSHRAEQYDAAATASVLSADVGPDGSGQTA